jgi:hypothetical protein
MSDCNEFVNKLAYKLEDKNEKKIIPDSKNVSRMKKKLNKYFIYISKDEIIDI